MSYIKEARKAFLSVYNSNSAKEVFELGEQIKKLDKSTDKKMTLIKFTSVISMALLGFLAFDKVGAIIFALIALFSSFFLQLSSKKNLIMKYFTFYRTRIPRLIAESDGIEVTLSEPDKDDLNFIASLFPEYSLKYRVCHKYYDLCVGFAKFMEKDLSRIQGVTYFFKEVQKSETELREALDTFKCDTFNSYKLLCDGEKVCLILIGTDNYLDGSIDKTDDLMQEKLLIQLDYYLIGKAFMDFARNKLDALPDLTTENTNTAE